MISQSLCTQIFIINVRICATHKVFFNSNNWNLHQNIFLGEEIKEGEIRLVGGGYSWEGRVEIFLFGFWGTVSHSAWYYEAKTVCRQLGYETYGKHIFEFKYIQVYVKPIYPKQSS